MGYSNYYEKLKKGLTTSLTVAAGAVSRAAEVAKDLAEDVLTLKCLKDYKLAGHVATAGPGNSWKISAAVNKKPGAVFPEASVWILDKKGLIDQASRAGRARGFDSFFELQRRSCNQLVKIKHPGVIKVIEPLEETSGQMVFVTEPIFGSLSNMLTQFRDVPAAPEDRSGAVLSPLEVKYGLCHIADTLHFLHSEARLAHCNLNPGSVIVTKDGGWKLAGFEFAGGIADFGGPSGAAVAFEYTSAHPSPWEEYCAPPLPYTAPELVGGCMASSAASLSGADCFSLAALCYQLLAGRQLLPVGSSTGEYRSRLSGLGSADMSGVAGSLQPLLRAMLSQSAAARPNAAAFAGCQWFAEDMLLRCLKFLDSILQRDSGQKVAFLRDLSTCWQQFDDRLLQHRVLPPIVQQMRSDAVALAALPVVLAIMGRMKPQGFAASGILPVLKPIFEHADGEVLLALVRHLSVFYNLMPSDAHASVLMPLMLRAFDSNSTRAQEETLKALQRLAPDMPYALLRQQLMPRVVGLCLRTTSLVVRTSALALMAQAAHRLDKEAAGAMLDVCSQIVAVDRSAGTAMAVLRLGDAIGKHYGPELTCIKVLPLLCPLLVSPGLNPQLFGSYISTVRVLLDTVAEKTGSALAAAADAAGTANAAAAAGSKPAGMYVRLLLLAAAALAICQADSLGGRKLQQGFGDPGQQTCPIQYCKEASACVYSSRTKAWQCKSCNFPRIPNTRQTECVCPAGMYPMANGGCAPCKMNQFCPLGQSATTTTARNCPPNTVTLKTGARSVNDCFNKPGYRYFRTSSGVRAIACGDDEYTVGLKKQTTCTRCMPGFKTDPANPPGIHTSSAVCVAPPGSFVAGDSVVPCPKGEYSDSYDSSTSCTTCLDEFGEGITTEKANSTSRSDCKWLERGYALVDDRKRAVLTTLSVLVNDQNNRQWVGAKPCPQNYYCRGGNPESNGVPLPCPGTGANQLWTEGEGAIAVDECVAPPGFVYKKTGVAETAEPCEQGQYKEGWNRLTTCDYCAGTSISSLLTNDLWLSDPTTFINKLDPNTGITMQQVAVRGSPENCYIQRGMGVMSMRDIKTGTTFFQAVICPADSYGINGPNPGTGVFKKYGRTITPCTACPTNMKTGQYATDAVNAENKITDYLTKVAPLMTTTTLHSLSAAGGYFSVDACATQDGYGYYSGSSQICPAGTYNGKGNKDPCTQCPFGTTTDSGEDTNVDVGSCSVYIQGYGLVNGATAMCAVGTWQGVDKAKDSDGEACTTCPVGYVTGDVGSISAANCSLCAAGYGDFDPLTGNKAAHTDLAGLTCQFCPAGYYGPASRTATPCLACPTSRTYTYSWDGTDDVFSPLATSPAGAKDINDCVADMAQTVDGAFELPLVLSHRAVTKLPDADNLKTCAQRCRETPTCAAVTFDYLEVACYMWQPVTDKPFNLAGGVAVKVFPSQNLALSTKVQTKAMGNGQYTFWMDGDESAGVPAALNTSATYYTTPTLPSSPKLQDCLDACTNSNLCVGARFGAYTLATDEIDATPSSTCRLIMAKVQPGNSRRSLIKADFNSFTQSLVVPPGYYTDPGSNTIQLCNDDVNDRTGAAANAVSYYCLGGLVGVANRTVCPAALSDGVYTPPDAAKSADCWSLLKPGYQFTADARKAAACDANKYCPGSVVGGYTYTGTAGAGSVDCPTGTLTSSPGVTGTSAVDSTACRNLQPGYYYSGTAGVAPTQLNSGNVLVCTKGYFCDGDEDIPSSPGNAEKGRTQCQTGTTTATAANTNTADTNCNILLPRYYFTGESTAVDTDTIKLCPDNAYCPGQTGVSYSTVLVGILECPGYTCTQGGTLGNPASCSAAGAGGAGTSSDGQSSPKGCNKLDAGMYYNPVVGAASVPALGTTILQCPPDKWCDGTAIITVYSAVTGISGTCPTDGSTSVAGSDGEDDCTLVAGWYYTGVGGVLNSNTIQPCKPGNVCIGTRTFVISTANEQGLTQCAGGLTCTKGVLCLTNADCVMA
ncbi:hypothetical protein OEZ85_008786 [Tetradesmus obliquus]|uniref:Protein kinase domain-containing protein n=1 Tax=Tetradesmus obliquus TaxID=3088 RepID=A0ABY8TK79_TETOB|nr:hypothetical protein OEZ85_008786 [Tetradesmus obliquus]